MDEEKILLALLIFGTLYVNSIGLSIATNNSYNSRDNGVSCHGYNNRSRSDTEDGKCHLNIENCLCNDFCIDHGECVRDIMISFSNSDIYMKRNCLPDWTDKEVKDLCLMALPLSISQIAPEDLSLNSPVTSNCTKVSYSNYYCAICNDESPIDIIMWDTEIKCISFKVPVAGTFGLNINETYLRENLQIVNNIWGVYLNKSDQSSFLECTASHVAPLSTNDDIHKCMDYTAECAPNWTDLRYQAMCYSYTNIACDKINYKVFKNVHCAVCNSAVAISLDCNTWPFVLPDVSYSISPDALLVLVSFSSESNGCPIGSIWNDEAKQCRPVVCYQKNSKYKHGSCTKVRDYQSSFNASEAVMWNLTSCDKKIFINETEYFIVPNGIVHINATGRIYKKDEYELYENGIYVCVPKRFSATMAWITFCGLTLSSVCLFLHLLAFAIVPNLRNLPGMNMASLCIALLVASICFIMTAFKKSAITGCSDLASLIYYFFFASFMWMNVMAFDIWQTVRMSTSKFQVSSGRNLKKFLFYSLYAWVTPGIALTVVLTIDHNKNLSPEYLPELGETVCWFGQKNAIFIYFTGPLAVVMSANVIFFVFTIRNIIGTSNFTNSSSQANCYKKQLKLYIKLAVVIGLSWVSGIVAGSTDNKYLNYLFIFLNSFQGLFILISYTCTFKVRKCLKNYKILNAFKFASEGPVSVSDPSAMIHMNNVNTQNAHSCSNPPISHIASTATTASNSQILNNDQQI